LAWLTVMRPDRAVTIVDAASIVDTAPKNMTARSAAQ
jgi:hypothetical protein